MSPVVDHPAAGQGTPEPAETLRLEGFFGDGMVLQRDQPVVVGGRAPAGVSVVVGLAGLVRRGEADETGRWSVGFPPFVCGGPHELRVEAGGEIRIVRDVWFGEVWLVAGQSNVIWPHRFLSPAEQARHEDFWRDSGARVWQMPERGFAEADEIVPPAPWLRPARDGPPAMPLLPAALAHLLEEAVGERVGMIVSALGGSRISSWLPRSAYAGDTLLSNYLRDYPDDPEDYDAILAEWREARERFERNNGKCLEDNEPAIPMTKYLFWGPRGTRNLSYPGGAFDAMIRPLAQLALRGVVWYQGESDAEICSGYGKRLRNMIEAWRTLWFKGCKQPRLPFVVLQLPAYAAGADTGNWPFLREEQERAACDVDDVYCVPTPDLGDPDDIHPADKTVFARRLLPAVRALTVDETPPSAPAIREVGLRGGVERPFVEVMTDAPLRPTDAEILGFEILDAGGDTLPVRAGFSDPQTLTIALPVAPRAYRGLRYNFRPVPEGRLYGLNGLPLRPFRTDQATPPYRGNGLY